MERQNRIEVGAMKLTKIATAIAAIAAAALALTPPAHADGLFMSCPSGRDGVIAGTPTTCAFADDVRSAWFGQPGNPVIAYSPVTDQTYRMFCIGNQTVTFTDGHIADAVQCVGGNDAEVVVW
jgi:hypothetical protein